MYRYFCSSKECGFEMWSHKVEAKLYCYCGYLVAHEDPHEIVDTKKTVKKSRSRKSSTCDKSNRGSISQNYTHGCTGEVQTNMNLFDYNIQEGTGEGT